MIPHSRTILRLALLLALACCSGFLTDTVRAQEETAATINGQVTDSTGAIVTGATVVVTNTATNAERRIETNDDGLFIVTPLSPGTYVMTVEQPNFKRYEQNNVVLNARDRRPVNIVLEAGNVTEIVTVTADQTTVQDSPTTQTLISGTQIVELPLNNRDFLKLTELVPGVSSSIDDESTFGLTSRASISINGMRRNAVNYLVDGVTNTDPGSNITLLSTPTVDSIKEFKVLTSNYTAEIGRSGGGVVTVVTRGGGNDFHGSLYEFVRNDRFNANSFFNNSVPRRADGSVVSPVPKLRYNNFGGTFSGPLPYPNFSADATRPFNLARNKTFFFFSEEARRIIRGLTDSVVTVPNAADRAGNFAPRLGLPLYRQANGTVGTTVTATPITAVDTNGQTIPVRVNQIFVPGTSTAYANNTIPTSQFDSRAIALLQAFPLPNSGTNNFISSRVNLNNTRQETLRIDHNFNDNNRIFGRYTHDLSETQEPGGLFTGLLLPNIATTNTRVPGQTLAISYTSILSATTVNETTYNFSGSIIGSVPVGRGLRSDYPGSEAIPEIFPENNVGAIPNISISTFSGSLASTQGFNIITKVHAFRDVLTTTRGNHTLKFGAEISFEKKAENANNNTQGSFAFSGTQTAGAAAFGGTTFTGLGIASYLLGRASSYGENERDVSFDFRFGRREFFVQDTWKIRPNLTLDYGVRYQYYTPIRDKDNILTSFDPNAYNPALAPQCTPVTGTAVQTCATLVRGTGNTLNGIIVAGVNSPYENFIAPRDLNNFSPRVGIAYSPFANNRTIIRAGYGFYYDQPLTGIFGQNVQVNPPYNQRVTYNTSGTTLVTLASPNGGLLGSFSPPALIATDPNFITPETQQWSLGIQHQLFRNALIDISYVGTKGDHLIRPVDINFAQPTDIQRLGGTSTINVINAARPYQGYGSITYLESSGISRYHGLLSSLVYRFTTGSSISLAYTFSKNLANATNDRDAIDIPQNPLDKDADYAEARSSRPHVFSAGYVYELPFFRRAENSAVRLLLGGYQISGITQIQSGLPIPRVLNASTNNGLRGNRPDQISDPRGGLAGQTDANGLPYLFDPTAFAYPADGNFGTSPRAFARLPYQNQTNLSLIKNIRFRREGDFRLQLRAESFNIFNKTQFTAVGASFNPALALTATNFGRPISARLPREFQFAAKLYF